MTFPTSPTNGQTTQRFGKKFAYSTTSGAWRPVSSPVVATVREPIPTPAVVSSASGLPMTGNTVGKTAYVSETNRLYIWNGSGWFEMALINTSPTITTGGDATYALAEDGTPTVINLVANDPEGVPLTWSHAVTSGSLEDVTISNTGAVFTITPGAIAATFGLTFTASDGINIDTSASAFTLSFGPDWAGTTLVQTLDDPNAYGTSVTDNFGTSVSMSGDYAIVSAKFEADAGGANSGKVYIFNVTTGALLFTLDNPNPYGTSANDQFGFSVGISGNYAIVSAPYEDSDTGLNPGKVYIFNVTTGALLFTLDNPNAYGTGTGDNFGEAVAISGDYAIVGAQGEDDAGGNQSGKAYIFNVTTGALVHTLDNPNAYGTSLQDYFGFPVAISGNYAIVGAAGEDESGGSNSGKAYIFNVTTGALVHTLDNPNAYGTSTSDFWSYSSISMDGNYAVISTIYEDDAGGADSGKAYVFNVSTGALLFTLDNPNAVSTSGADNFGMATAISGDYAIIGAPFEDDSGQDAGKAYIFDVTTGVLLKTLDNPNAYGTSVSDQFGYSVGISGNYIIVGAQGEDDAGGDGAGKAYIFQAG
jgi:hypothetical protein